VKYLRWLFSLLLAITVPNPLVSQVSEKTRVLEVVVPTHDVTRIETLIYLRVFFRRVR
jgi:hypothetical protein